MAKGPKQEQLPPDDGGHGIEDIDLGEEVQTSFLEYAMSVIVSRALPDVRDGLKPIHRRILYAALESGLRPDQRFRKCAALVGEVMKTYHPHGDQSIYDALARLAQDFSTRNLLINGQGNFGSVDGDAPAAMRYCLPSFRRVLGPPDGSVRIGDFALFRQTPRSISTSRCMGKDGAPVHATKLFHSGTHPTLKLDHREGLRTHRNAATTRCSASTSLPVYRC